MARRIFKRFRDCALYRGMRVRLDPVEGREVWNHDFYANSPLARLPSGGRPYDGYVIVDIDGGRDIGLALRGRYGIKIPYGDGWPESGVDRLPNNRLWIPVHASCEAGIACQMLWEAVETVVTPVTLKGATRRPPPPPDDPISDQDLDALAGLAA